MPTSGGAADLIGGKLFNWLPGWRLVIACILGGAFIGLFAAICAQRRDYRNYAKGLLALTAVVSLYLAWGIYSREAHYVPPLGVATESTALTMMCVSVAAVLALSPGSLIWTRSSIDRLPADGPCRAVYQGNSGLDGLPSPKRRCSIALECGSDYYSASPLNTLFPHGLGHLRTSRRSREFNS
jgi:hypothetical protein